MKKTLIIGERYMSLLEKPLRDFGIEALWMQDNPYIDPRLAGHADLSAIVLGNKIVVGKHIAESPIYVNYLTYMGYRVIAGKRIQGIKYPNDANLCACVIGEHLIHNLQYTDPAILDSFTAKKIHVNQGYAKCSCCVVSAESLISSDTGIERAVSEKEIEVLKINPGGITLAGFDYGFIGGASIVLDDTVLFSGKLENTHDMRSIESFIRNRGKYPVYLTDKPAFDIGSAAVL